MLDVMGHFCLDWGGVVGDSCCTENLLEDGLKGLRVDVVVDEFLADAGAAKVMVNPVFQYIIRPLQAILHIILYRICPIAGFMAAGFSLTFLWTWSPGHQRSDIFSTGYMTACFGHIKCCFGHIKW